MTQDIINAAGQSWLMKAWEQFFFGKLLRGKGSNSQGGFVFHARMGKIRLC
jgi:hypothetical protein